MLQRKRPLSYNYTNTNFLCKQTMMKQKKFKTFMLIKFYCKIQNLFNLQLNRESVKVFRTRTLKGKIHGSR